MNMAKPPHPGRILKSYYIEPLKMTISDAAGYLDLARSRLSQLVNAKMSVSPAMALRLAKGFDTSPQYWMNMQTQYDLAQARKNAKLGNVKCLVTKGSVR